MAGRTVQSLIHELAGVPHSAARGLVDAGCARTDGRTIEDHAERLAAGARVILRYDPQTRYRPRPRPRPGDGYRVVHEDRDIVVVDKEAGLLSVPAPAVAAPSLAERLVESFASRGENKPRLYAVHRLDRQVSGLLVFARSLRALEGLVRQFDTHAARRGYVAIVEGVLGQDSGTLRSRLREDPRSRRVGVAREGEPGKPAVTHWRVVERFRDATLCRIELETGRKNQIRVQFAAAGHPVVGDERYGRGSERIRRVALHAELLEFEHPARRERASFRSPLPADLVRLIDRLRAGSTKPAAPRDILRGRRSAGGHHRKKRQG
jgi:23S rRNA pseudouridine1911/1915/1917 synthase